MAIGAIGLGLSFLGQGLGAFGQYQGQQAEADYNYRMGKRQAKLTNFARTQQYERDVRTQRRQWQQALQIRGAENARYSMQLGQNMYSAGRAYSQEYERIAEAFDAAKFQGQDNLISLIENEGKLAATGRSGRGITMNDQKSVAAKVGQRQSMLADNLTRNVASSKGTMQDIWNQTNTANWNAWFPVSTPLMQPDPIAPPTMMSMPTRQSVSPMGMYGSILGAAGSLFGGIQSLKAPKVYG